MKCHACGYDDADPEPKSQEVLATTRQRPKPFVNIGCTFPMEPSKKKAMDLYACTMCGTVRVKLETEPTAI
jgi:hypothetical protein